MAKAKGKVSRKKKERKNIQNGIAHIQSTFNNTLITITDMNGNTKNTGCRTLRFT